MEMRLDRQRIRSIFGLGQPFATRWSLALLLGWLAFRIYRLTLPWIVGQFSRQDIVSYTIAVFYGPSALLLLALFAAHRRWCFPDIRFIGDIRRQHVVQGIAAVSAIYLAAYATTLWLGQPREVTMATLYDHKTPTQIAVMVACLLLLPPAVEELAFRHFLLSILPFKRNRWVAAVAVVATATFFSYQHHTSYQFMTTFLALFALGLVFALARIRSDGLVLPISLHAYAIAFALTCDQVVARIQA
ncbi:CPBP family intramembrane glutamic endopeptidase [Burkholderia ambifaria]|uniref:CPBP family intramembrane glutamic endopeptidase n=1 Tax=Burkholderia ambifaria TaxID=152480 RepID=UPI002FDFB962